MNLQQEVEEIIANAKAAYKRGEITFQQYQDATRIPIKDLELTTAPAREQERMTE